MDKQLEDFFSKYPFFALVKYAEHEFVCIIQNQDNDVLSIYDFHALKTEDEKKIFIELAEQWWWESSRMIPINIFLKSDWNQFKYTTKTLLMKEAKIVAGHAVCLNDLAAKRTKRKTFQFVKRPI